MRGSTGIAQLTEAQIERLKKLEEELGIVLVAYTVKAGSPTSKASVKHRVEAPEKR